MVHVYECLRQRKKEMKSPWELLLIEQEVVEKKKMSQGANKFICFVAKDEE